MLGGSRTDLLVTVALLFLTQTETQCRAENNFSSVTLPEWRTSSEYVTQCSYDKHNNRICDWTKSKQTSYVTEDIAVNILESGPLGLEGEACLEFWYLAPVAAKGSELHALLKNSTGEVEIWTSPAIPRDSWRQVFVPLNITEPWTQIVFKAAQAVAMEEQLAFNRIGVRRGTCGQQCESNTEFWTDESTHCLCSGGQLSCSPSKCPKGQICGPPRGNSSGIYASGTCSIHSNTDCSTFDGVLLRFLNPCTYTLAKTCSSIETVPTFIVDVINEQNGNSPLPTIQQVKIKIGSLRVSLIKKEMKQVVVNGVWKKLPLNLRNSTIDIKSNPATVLLATSFGLFVSVDNTGAVNVTLPSTYSDYICGLCRNFNQSRGDDFRGPSGAVARDATTLARSWQAGQTTSSCEAALVPYECDPGEEAEYASEQYCGGLFSSTGPFVECLSVLGAESYFRDCVVGMCSSNGDPAVLCETFRVYADICQEAGVPIPIWSNSTFCPIQCGQNSHYNSCADGCPEACSSLDIVSSCGSCVERCECDSGYKLSGGKCVQSEDCGCWFNGKHYEKGETLLEGECVEYCQCMGNNDMQCSPVQCAYHEVCKVKDGVKGCFSFDPSTCRVYGDPHYITFDGLAYDFQGGCSYTLTTTCGGDSSVQFTVIGHNMYPPLQNFTRSKLEAVTLQVEDLNLTLNQSGEVYVNNDYVQLPYSINGSYGSVWVHTENNYVILEATFGLKLMIDGQTRLFLQVDEHYKYDLCGLCGTFSDQQDDDLIKPGGQNVTEPFEFGDSWRVPDDNECTAQPNDPRRCDYEEEEDAHSECYTLLGNAFSSCHGFLHPSIYFDSCVYDYCATSGDRHTHCESLRSYAAACQVAGVELPDWEADTACAEFTTTTTTAAPTPPPPDPTLCPINCTFDNDLCGWEQRTEDNFDWTRNSGPTPSTLTGPDQDHTTGAGFYMYIDGSTAAMGDSAQMLSSECNYSGSLCLHFWYHMYGSATTMTLNIYLHKNNKDTKLWSMMNNQGPIWHPVYIDIKDSAPFQIIVEGIRGSNDQSDVAIDDISLNFGSCSGSFRGPVSEPELPSTTADILPSHLDLSGVVTSPPNPNGNTTAPPSVPAPTTAGPEPPLVNVTVQLPVTVQPPIANVTRSPVVEATTNLINKDNVTEAPDNTPPPPHPECQLDCNFEQGLCQWSQLPKDCFDWTRHSGSTPTLMTGPSSDHTTGDGYYLYVEANSTNHGDTARLTSSECLDSGPQCLQFWYHMYGSADAMGLHVYLLQDGKADAVWWMRNNQGNTWHLAQVDLTTTGAFQIIFEGRRGSNDQSNVAIDDVSLHRGRCTDLAKPTTPATTTSSGAAQPQTSISSKRPSTFTTTTTIRTTPATGINTKTTTTPATAVTLKTSNPEVPTTRQQIPQTSRPLATVTSGSQTATPHPLTTQHAVTETKQPGPEITGRPQTTARPEQPAASTIKPQPPTTARPQPQTETPPQLQTSVKPQPPNTAEPQPPTTARPQPRTQTPPQLQTSVKPQPPNTAEPQPPTTTTRKPPSTARPQPPTTTGPQAPTTAGPQPPTEPPTQLQTTVKQQLETASQTKSQPTNRPQPPATTTQKPPSPAGPQPPTTAPPQAPTETSPQPQTTAKAQPPTTSRKESQTTAGLQPPTTAKQQPPTTLKPQLQTTARPQPPTTAGPQPSTETPSQPQITNKPLMTTGRPQSTTTTTSQSTTTARPLPATTPLPPPSCPENSHYTSCIPACSPTCTQLNGPPRCRENEGCVQGCVCNEGFVQKGRVCVPIQQCGCLDRDGAKRQFNEVWYTNHCSQKYECEKHHGVGRIDYDDKDGCKENAICLQNEDGNYYCQSTGFDECAIKKDHEYRTFDKMKYDFEGEHSYVLVQTKNLPSNLPDVYIKGINTLIVHDDDDSQHHGDGSSEEDHSRRVTDDDTDDDDDDYDEDYDDDDGHEDDSEEHEEHQGLQEIMIRVYNHTVEFKKNRRLVVNGRRSKTPVSPAAGLSIYKRSFRIYLKTDFGLLVAFHRRSTAEITLPRMYKRKVGGLCGNYDDQKWNDWIKPDGTRARSADEFGESWRV